MLSSRDRNAGAQINLVTKKSEVRPQSRAQIALNFSHLLNRTAAEVRRDRSQPGIIQIPGQSQRDDGDAGYTRIKLSQIMNCLLKDLVGVNLRAQHYLRMNFDAGVEHAPHLTRN